MATLESLELRLKELIDTLRATGTLGPRPAYENPPITEAEAIIDEKTVNKDGSIWTWDETTNGRTTEPQKIAVRLSYGYFSEAKDPATYAAIVERFGDTFLRWHAKQNKWTLYAGDPKAYMDTGAANWITLVSYVLVPRGIHVQ